MLPVTTTNHQSQKMKEYYVKYCSTSSIDNETHSLIECPATDSLGQTLWNTAQSVQGRQKGLKGGEANDK